MKSKIETDYRWGSWNLLAWKKGRRFPMPPLVSSQKKDVLVRNERRLTYWWLVATLIWVVLLIGRSNFFYQLSQKHMPLVIINDCFVSRIPCSFLFPLVPLFPCSPVPLVPPCYPLFPPVPPVPPCSPFPPLFPLFLPCSSCSPLFSLVPLVLPCSLLFPLSPFVPLVPAFSPSSPVPLFHLQFTTLNFWQSQISVNKKKNDHISRETPLKAGYRIINTLPKRFFTRSGEDS